MTWLKGVTRRLQGRQSGRRERQVRRQGGRNQEVRCLMKRLHSGRRQVGQTGGRRRSGRQMWFGSTWQNHESHHLPTIRPAVSLQLTLLLLLCEHITFFSLLPWPFSFFHHLLLSIHNLTDDPT